MSSRKKRASAPRPARPSADQAELANLLSRSDRPGTPDAPPPTPGASSAAGEAPAPSPQSALATFTIDEISTAVRYWGDDATDRGGAKVAGGFGPNACVVIEVLTLLTVSRERTVACSATSNLGRLVDEALRAAALTQTPAHLPAQTTGTIDAAA